MNEPNESNIEVIKAAGGIIERQAPSGIEIMLVHRNRYESEWCLPKGKLKDQENWRQTALREVKEETGYDCSLKEFADTISYITDNNSPKLVLFWKMEVKGPYQFQPSEEVDKVEWFPLSQAVSRLKHPKEIELVKQTYPETNYLKNAWKLSAASRFFQSHRQNRLGSAILVFKMELKRHIDSKTPNDQLPSWITLAFDLLDQAQLALRDGNIEKGWKCFLGAQRMEIFGLDEKEELSARVKVLQEEASKLQSWRKKALEHLLGSSENPKEVNDKAIVYEAALIRDEHYNNQAYKGALNRDLTFYLSISLALVLIGIFLTIGNISDLPDKNPTPPSRELFLNVMLFGLLGGVVSAILKAIDLDQSSRIPEMLTSIYVTFLRIFVGGAFAIIIIIFLKSQFVSFLNPTVAVAVKSLNIYSIYAISFVSGFTERLALRAIEAIATKGK